jgi:hypothetical protein
MPDRGFGAAPGEDHLGVQPLVSVDRHDEGPCPHALGVPGRVARQLRTAAASPL